MKKILILFSLIGCLSFAEEFKCKGNKDKDILDLKAKTESTIKKTYVFLSNDDNTLKKEILEEKKHQSKIIDHLLKEHLNDLSITEVETLVKIKDNLQFQCETISLI